MNILITGANGFIGSHLTERLVVEGHKVTCFVRSTSNLRWIEHLSISYRYDLAELDQYDVIYHIAGRLGQKKLPLDVYRGVHVLIPAKILSGMNEHQKFVYMSSAWSYSPKHPYEHTKLEGEEIIRSSNVPYTIVRPGFVIGPRDLHHLPLYQWIEKLGRLFPIVGNGKNEVCPTYVEDVVNILVRATELGGIIPIAGKPITMQRFVHTIADALSVGRPLICVPFGPKHDFFATERVFPTITNNTVPLKLALKKTVEWYKQNGLLRKGG